MPNSSSENINDPHAQNYECHVCQQTFGFNEVYDDHGKIICAGCFAKSRAGAAPAAASPAAQESKKPPNNPPPTGTPDARQSSAKTLLPRIVCPHCWHRFPPESILWVSQHAELIGDPVLGSDAASRFLPTRFTIEGDALDARGMRSQTLATPISPPKIPLIAP